MGKFDGILICTDLDGTLYKKDKTISKENLDAIEFFKAEGGKFTFITGRMPFVSKTAYEEINPNCPFGCINGGGIYDHIKQDYVWYSQTDKSVMELVEYIDTLVPEIGIEVNCRKKGYFCKDNDATELFRQRLRIENNIRHYKDIDEPVLKVIFAATREETLMKVADLLDRHPLADKFDFVRSEKILYEILPKNTNKGFVLKKMAELTGTDISRTVAIGDYLNDIEMLQTAGVGIAVENARDEVKAVADRITVSHEESAIAKVIEEIEKGIIEF